VLIHAIRPACNSLTQRISFEPFAASRNLLAMSDAAERLYERMLIVRCQTGAPLAFSELIARYSSRVRFYLRNIAGDAAADDLLQDVWMDVFAKVGRLRDPGAFGCWIYQVVRARAYRELRGRRLPCMGVDDLPAAELDQVEVQWDPQDVERVRTALELLPAEHREVLVLRFIQDMSYEQIATVIARPVGTVRSRLHYAKQALREAMDNGR
jgi:RNA polymerase sigma-70 factor (ECF subfamily)